MVDAAVELQQPSTLVKRCIPREHARSLLVNGRPRGLEQRVVVGGDGLADRE